MTQENPNTFFFKAFRKALKPLMRLAINRGVSVNELLLNVRSLSVEVAEDFKVGDKKQSSSRIAVLTGMDRKEVARLRKINEDTEAVYSQQSRKINRAIRAINAWKTHSCYQENGEPKPLPLNDGEFNFTDLVKEFCGDVSATSILLELEQNQLIEISDNNIVSLVKTSYTPSENQDEMFTLMGQASYDLINTMSFNTQSLPKDSRLQLSVAYDDVTDDVARKFKVLVKRDSRELLEKLNSWLSEELELYGDEEKDKPRRIGLGIYYFEDEITESKTPKKKA